MPGLNLGLGLNLSGVLGRAPATVLTVDLATFTASGLGSRASLNVDYTYDGGNTITGYAVVGTAPFTVTNEQLIAGSDGSGREFFNWTVSDAVDQDLVDTLTTASNGADTIIFILTDGTIESAQETVAATGLNFTAPTVSSTAPADEGTAGVDDDFVITLSEDPYEGSGNFYLYNASDTLISTIAAASCTYDTGADTVTVPLPTMSEVGHYMQWDAGVVVDADGNNLAGVSNKTSYNFTVSASTGRQDIVDMIGSDTNAFFWDVSDEGLGDIYEERASQTTVSSVDGVVGSMVDASANGYVSQVDLADANRPLLRNDSGRYSLECDGTDDLFPQTTDLPNNTAYSVFVAFETGDTTFIGARQPSSATNYAFAAQDGSSSTVLEANAGSPSYYINNSLLSSPTTRNDLHDALPTPAGTRCLLEIRNLDTSTNNWGGINPMAYASGTFRFDGKIGPVIVVTETLRATGSNHQKILDYFESKGWYTP